MALFGIPGTKSIERRLNNAVDNLISKGERAVGDFVRDVFDGDSGGGGGSEATAPQPKGPRPRKAGARLYVVRLADLDSLSRILAWGVGWIDVNGPVRLALVVDGIDEPILVSGSERWTAERLVQFEASGGGVELEGTYGPSDLTPAGSGLVRLPDGSSWPVLWTASFRGVGPMPRNALDWFVEEVLEADERDERVDSVPSQFESNPFKRAARWAWDNKGSIVTAVATIGGLVAAWRAN